MRVNNSSIAVASMIILLAIGIGIGWGFRTTVLTPGGSISTTQSASPNQPYVLTLAITTGNTFNSTIGDQPVFYVLTPQGLRSSANISLPANTLIKLIIVNYDEGNATVAGPQYANVQGTVNGTMTYVNNSNANSTEGTGGIRIVGGETVTKVSTVDIAHTFTIPALGINIPVPVSSTVVAYIRIDRTGNFTWFCETACGAGADGLQAAMSTPGWMTGNIEAS